MEVDEQLTQLCGQERLRRSLGDVEEEAQSDNEGVHVVIFVSALRRARKKFRNEVLDVMGEYEPENAKGMNIAACRPYVPGVESG